MHRIPISVLEYARQARGVLFRMRLFSKASLTTGLIPGYVYPTSRGRVVPTPGPCRAWPSVEPSVHGWLLKEPGTNEAGPVAWVGRTVGHGQAQALAWNRGE